jgi:hypothetical protein
MLGVIRIDVRAPGRHVSRTMKKPALVAFLACVASAALADDARSNFPHRHATLAVLGASQPISASYAACLKPVDEALASNLRLLTTVKPSGLEGGVEGIRPLKPTDELIAEYRAEIEATDWAPRAASALRADREATALRQKDAHDTLIALALTRGDNIMEGMALDKKLRATTAGDPAIERQMRTLEERLELLDDEILKLATVARYADARMAYYDCALTSSSPARR